jgi:hypothetical protein
VLLLAAVLGVVAAYACGGVVQATSGDAGNGSGTGGPGGSCPPAGACTLGAKCFWGNVTCLNPRTGPVPTYCSCEAEGWVCEGAACGSETRSSSIATSSSSSSAGNACTEGGGVCVPFNPGGFCPGGTAVADVLCGEEQAYCCAPITSSSSSTSADAGSGSGRDASTGDTDASCEPPDGGPTCTPGFVECGSTTNGTAACSVPGSQCCETSVDACQLAGAACSGTIIECDEKGDCADGDICCVNAMTGTTATFSCQPGPACPIGTGLESAQICRSDAECASGSCSFYSCSATNPSTIVEACDKPMGLLGSSCTKM